MSTLEKNTVVYTKDDNIAIWDYNRMKLVYMKKSRYLDSSTSSHSDYWIDSSESTEVPHNLESVMIENCVLLVTNECNFNCAYCQIEENINDQEVCRMSKETAIEALNLLYAITTNSNRCITITGGEPLLNWSVVKAIIEYVRFRSKDDKIVIFTNGSLVTSEIATFLSEMNVLVLVSLDGPQEVHDKFRVTHNNIGTFDKVMKGYKELLDKNVDVGISAVGGSHNKNDFQKTMDFFCALNPKSLGFNISHLLIDKENPSEISSDTFGSLLKQLYLETRSKGIYLENIHRIIKSFATRTPKTRECQAHGKGFTVDSRGLVGPCKSLLVSDIYSTKLSRISKISAHPIFKEWKIRSPLNSKNCEHCPAKMVCGGGCAYDSYILNDGNFKNMDFRVCDYTNDILEFIIWDYFDKNVDLSEAILVEPTSTELYNYFYGFFDSNDGLRTSIGH